MKSQELLRKPRPASTVCDNRKWWNTPHGKSTDPSSRAHFYLLKQASKSSQQLKGKGLQSAFHATSFLQQTSQGFCCLHFSKGFNSKAPWGENRTTRIEFWEKHLTKPNNFQRHFNGSRNMESRNYREVKGGGKRLKTDRNLQLNLLKDGRGRAKTHPTEIQTNVPPQNSLLLLRKAEWQLRFEPN